MQSLLPWFTLAGVHGIGPHLFKRLLDKFDSPAAVLGATASRLQAVAGISAGLARAIASHKLPDTARAEIAAATEGGVRIVTLRDPQYPPLLLQIADPPPWLYVLGDLTPCRPAVAMVGARSATAYGLSAARRLATHLALRGVTVVSGMAVGIDTAAHQGALEAGGRTVAVLGSGLGRIYPPQNRRLCVRIAAAGAVISELPMHAGPDAHHFPRRNRIISGMSLGTVVVEASRRSGALITARMAADQNREVFAVPGSIGSLKSAGSHHLIRQGAKLVERVEDILEELVGPLGAAPAAGADAPDPDPPAPLTDEAGRVLDALDAYPAHIDVLARRLDLPPGVLAGVLLELEVAGHVVQWPGKRFARKV
jgi:DNA processing protein